MAVIRWVCSLHPILHLLALRLLPFGSAHCSHARHTHERAHMHTCTHAHTCRVFNCSRRSCIRGAWSSGWSVWSRHGSPNPVTGFHAPHQQVSMTLRGGGCGGWEERAEEEAQFNNAKATSVSQMERLLPRDWAWVGLKHRAPAAPHDCADITA